MDANLSHNEMLVALAVHRLRGEGYGVTLREKIASDALKNIAYGTLYSTLDRLEKRGFISSRMGKATQVRGGRRKKHYAITGEGVDAMTTALAEVDRLRDRSVWARVLADATTAGVGSNLNG